MSELQELQELHTNEDLEKVWDKSTQEPVFIFKQSTTCPISAEAFDEYQTFLGSQDDVETYFVKVRETRDVSNQIAEETGVQHQSPQALLIKDREAIWHTSHSKITNDSLTAALEQYK